MSAAVDSPAVEDEEGVIVAGGLRWLPEDRDATPIGYSIAVEHGGGGEHA